MAPEFLQIADVLTLHTDQIKRYGGESGVRDMGLLESALAQPQAGFGGEFLHGFPYEMAAAYLFHLVKNHPFMDGNKRAGTVAALVFLDFNGVELDVPEGELYDLTMAVACGAMDKKRIAEFFEQHARG
jgi:death-on-curing protein